MRLIRQITLAILLSLFLFRAADIYAALPGARSETVSGDVFLGGDYIELGISQYGSFGTDQSKPESFFGTAARTNIGMSSDLDGFDTGTDWRMDFFMPGTREERWGIGYTLDGSPVTAANAKANGSLTGISDNTVTDQSEGDVLQATSVGTLNSNLRTTQVISFRSSDKFFRNTVTLENVSESNTLTSVRFMRSFDPDNTVDKGGSYTTRNSIDFTHAAGDGKAVVQASTANNTSDPVYLGTGGAEGGTRSPIFFYSSDDRARVNYHSSLVPGTVYTTAVYDTTNPKGSSEDRDGAISIAFDVGTLEPGESQTFVYYTSLDSRDFAEVEQEIQEDEAQNAPKVSEPENETTEDTATVSWTTDIAASALIEYGLVPTYGFTTDEINTDPLATEHVVTISNLKPCARYFYRTKSTNEDDASTYSEQATFTTTGCSVSAIVEGSESQITLAGGNLSFNTSSVSAELQIPENFADQPASFQINRLSSTDSTPTGKRLLPNRLFDLIAVDDNDTQITSFNTPVTFIVSYEDVDLTDIDESTLDVYKYLDGSWVAQNCTLDTTEKTLTCSLPSFSVYGVFGDGIGGSEPEPTPSPSSSSKKSSDKKQSSSCKTDHIMSAPDLFQIDMSSDTATVFFTPLLQTNQYYISYSTNSNAEEHGALVTLSSDGVQSFTIEELQPHQTYYFKVRGHKDCTPGPWSNSKSGVSESEYTQISLSNGEQSSQENSTNESVDTQELSESDTSNKPEEDASSNEISATGGLYDVYVVVKSGGETISSATVELPELNMQATTNEEGVAVFKDVERGSHVFKLVKDAYAAEETITVEGDEKDFDVSITLEVQENFFSSHWPWLLVVLLLLLIIIWLARSKSKNK